MSFLKDDYKKPASNSRYYKFAVGDNLFRILGDAITGFIDWQDNGDGGRKPIRTAEKPERSINPAKPVKHFWAFPIWDYRENNVKILEITQAGIQDTIFNLHKDENWGDPKSYNLNVKRIGEDLNTKYTVVPNPPKELSPEIAKIYSETKINLNALYEGGDPFADDKQAAPDENIPMDDIPAGEVQMPDVF